MLKLQHSDLSQCHYMKIAQFSYWIIFNYKDLNCIVGTYPFHQAHRLDKPYYVTRSLRQVAVIIEYSLVGTLFCGPRLFSPLFCLNASSTILPQSLLINDSARVISASLSCFFLRRLLIYSGASSKSAFMLTSPFPFGHTSA